jgi:uncharacterized protein YndB with AHSA1/START domain
MECAVQCAIQASPAAVWRLLTDSTAFPKWNSTVTSIEGDVALGAKLTIRVPVSERAFTPKVTAFEPEARMVWSDGMAPMFMTRPRLRLGLAIDLRSPHRAHSGSRASAPSRSRHGKTAAPTSR